MEVTVSFLFSPVLPADRSCCPTAGAVKASARSVKPHPSSGARWASQENPDPKVGPQSHPAKSKINSTYFVQNGNYSLKTNYYFYSYPVVAFDNGNIQIIDDIDSFFYEEDFDLLKLITNSNDNKGVERVLKKL